MWAFFFFCGAGPPAPWKPISGGGVAPVAPRGKVGLFIKPKRLPERAFKIFKASSNRRFFAGAIYVGPAKAKKKRRAHEPPGRSKNSRKNVRENCKSDLRPVPSNWLGAVPPRLPGAGPLTAEYPARLAPLNGGDGGNPIQSPFLDPFFAEGFFFWPAGRGPQNGRFFGPFPSAPHGRVLIAPQPRNFSRRPPV